jgi:hypothetical protein
MIQHANNAIELAQLHVLHVAAKHSCVQCRATMVSKVLAALFASPDPQMAAPSGALTVTARSAAPAMHTGNASANST